MKVEITPPRDLESITLPASFSIDSGQTVNLSINLTDYKTPTTSPQQRKLSELPTDTLLSAAANFGRLTPSPSSGSSCKLYKKFEEFLDLSSPYNHYRCLSPSESNLTQCHDGKYIYGISKLDNKPGSSRLLRRQFSLDKDDCQGGSSQSTNTISQLKTSLDVPLLQDIPLRSSPSPTSMKPGRLHKQTSASVAQDLEKIEEIPISPTSLINHRHYLSQIPGSAAGSPASKKPNDVANANEMPMTPLTPTTTVVTISTLDVPVPGSDLSRAASPMSATTICSNTSNGSAADNVNNNGNICYHI